MTWLVAGGMYKSTIRTEHELGMVGTEIRLPLTQSGQPQATVGESGQGPITYASGFGKPERGVPTYDVGDVLWRMI